MTKLKLAIYDIDLLAKTITELSHGTLEISDNDRKGALMRCQKMFGPCRGSSESQEWKFLTPDGLIVVVKYIDKK